METPLEEGRGGGKPFVITILLATAGYWGCGQMFPEKPRGLRPLSEEAPIEFEAIVREEFQRFLREDAPRHPYREHFATHTLQLGRMEVYRRGGLGLQFYIYAPYSEVLWWERDIRFVLVKDAQNDLILDEAMAWIREGLNHYCETGHFGVGLGAERSITTPLYEVETSGSFVENWFPNVTLFRFDAPDARVKEEMWLEDYGWSDVTQTFYDH